MRVIRRLALAAALLTVASVAVAEVKGKEVTYEQGGTTLKGYLAYNDRFSSLRPGVLVVHEWWGNNEHARRAARRLAEAGCVAFALDMYGDGKTTTHPNEAQAFANEALKDPAVTNARFDAALNILKKDIHVDSRRLAAIGYCFGGGVVLQQARRGVDLKAVASFHGSLGTDTPAKPGAIKGRVLAMTGSADPFVPPSVVKSFEKEMKDAGVKYQVIVYPGAKHGFTNPDAAKYGMDALAYNAEADRKSWAAMLAMFKTALRWSTPPGGCS